MIKELFGTLGIQTFGLFKIPILVFIGPKLEHIDEQCCRIRIPLNYRTKNHMDSMYFGVLAAGADLAGGFIALQQIIKMGNKIDLLFKDFHADFLKRADGDVLFECTEGLAIKALVERAMQSEERQEMPMHIQATVPDKYGQEPVANFTLTLSLKRKKGK